MDIENFNRAIKGYGEDYYAVAEEGYYLVYRDTGRGSDFIGSVCECDMEGYDIEDICRYLGIA